jgi:hypothetical protein
VTAARVSIGLVALGGLLAALTQLPLAWDGSYIALNVLWSQEPFMPHGRWVNLPLQAPVLLASRWISDTATLGVIFSATYALLPAVALAVSWLVVRKRAPRLLVWPALGMMLALPGQAFFVSEAVLSTQLAWPLVLAVSLGTERRHVTLLAVLAIALAFAHPIAVGLLALVVVLWALRPDRPMRSHGRLGWAMAGLGIVMLVGIRYLTNANSYETSQVSVSAFAAQAQTLDAVRIGAIALVYLGTLFVLARHAAVLSRWVVLDALPVLAVLAAGILLVVWALDPLAWAQALEYRGLVPFVCAIPYVAAFLDARWHRPGSWDVALPRATPVVLLWAATTWAVVVGTQGLHWQATLRDFRGYLERSPTACVASSTIGGIERSPLNHWSVTTLSLFMSGQEPGRLVLMEDGCAQRLADGFPITGVETRPWESRWFVTEPLRSKIGSERTSREP